MHRRKRSVIVYKSKALQEREQREQKKSDEELFSFIDNDNLFSLRVFHEKRLEIRREAISTSSHLSQSSATLEVGCCYVVSLLMDKLSSLREATLRELCAAVHSTTTIDLHNFHRQRSSLGKTALVIYKDTKVVCGHDWYIEFVEEWEPPFAVEMNIFAIGKTYVYRIEAIDALHFAVPQLRVLCGLNPPNISSSSSEMHNIFNVVAADYNAELDVMEVDAVEMRKLRRYEHEEIDDQTLKMHFNEIEMELAMRKHVTAALTSSDLAHDFVRANYLHKEPLAQAQQQSTCTWQEEASTNPPVSLELMRQEMLLDMLKKQSLDSKLTYGGGSSLNNSDKAPLIMNVREALRTETSKRLQNMQNHIRYVLQHATGLSHHLKNISENDLRCLMDACGHAASPCEDSVFAEAGESIDHCFVVLKGRLRVKRWKRRHLPLHESDTIATTPSLLNDIPPRHSRESSFHEAFATSGMYLGADLNSYETTWPAGVTASKDAAVCTIPYRALQLYVGYTGKEPRDAIEVLYRNQRLWTHIKSPSFNMLTKHGRIRTYYPNERIISQGAPRECVLLMLLGSASVTRCINIAEKAQEVSLCPFLVGDFLVLDAYDKKPDVGNACDALRKKEKKRHRFGVYENSVVLFYPMHSIYDSAFHIFRALAIDCFARFAQHISADDDTVRQRYEDSMRWRNMRQQIIEDNVNDKAITFSHPTACYSSTSAPLVSPEYRSRYIRLASSSDSRPSSAPKRHHVSTGRLISPIRPSSAQRSPACKPKIRES